MTSDFWNKRFAIAEYSYGQEPNDFLRANAQVIAKGPVLCLAEGEGRNGVHLAELGYAVTGVDFSAEGQKKALALAQEHGTHINYELCDLTTYDLGEGRWSGVVSIWAAFAEPARSNLLGRVFRSLRPGGVFLYEGYSPEQLRFGTGGPKDIAQLASLRELTAALESVGFELVSAQQIERHVHEGTLHTGPSSTVQILAKRPAA